jgi:hypothetical protein
MTGQAVEEAVIAPMLAAFPAPRHVRGNRSATDILLDVYRRALERYDRPVLETAWQKVAAQQDYWIWPLPEALAEACEALRIQQARTAGEDWVGKATALADAYIRRFILTTQAAVHAREGGYETALKSYVTEAAWVQAQYIEGRQGIGYSSAVLFPNRERDKEAEERFFEKSRAQAETGHIKVVVPRELVERWKGQAQGPGRTR